MAIFTSYFFIAHISFNCCLWRRALICILIANFKLVPGCGLLLLGKSSWLDSSRWHVGRINIIFIVEHSTGWLIVLWFLLSAVAAAGAADAWNCEVTLYPKIFSTPDGPPTLCTWHTPEGLSLLSFCTHSSRFVRTARASIKASFEPANLF